MPTILHLDTELLIELGFQLLNTMVLVVVLAFVLYKPVLRFLKARSDRIANQIDSAQAAELDAENLKKLYEAKLKDIEKERSEILEAARKQAINKGNELLEEARKDAETIRRRANRDIERSQEKVKDEMKTQIIEISSLIAARYVEEKMDEATQNKLLSQVISDLGEAKWLN